MTRNIHIGDLVTFHGEPLRPYLAVAESADFVILNRPDDFDTDNRYYTIIDWDRNVRGPVNLLGGGYDTRTAVACAELISELEAGALEVSHRRQVDLDIASVVAA